MVGYDAANVIHNGHYLQGRGVQGIHLTVSLCHIIFYIVWMVSSV